MVFFNFFDWPVRNGPNPVRFLKKSRSGPGVSRSGPVRSGPVRGATLVSYNWGLLYYNESILYSIIIDAGIKFCYITMKISHVY
jgi:hypothetical protein